MPKVNGNINAMPADGPRPGRAPTMVPISPATKITPIL